MKKFRSHKIVEASKIVSIVRQTGSRVLNFEDGLCYAVTEAWCEKHEPMAPGYFVRYPDGYESWSPVAAFEEGYTELNEFEAKHEVSPAEAVDEAIDTFVPDRPAMSPGEISLKRIADALESLDHHAENIGVTLNYVTIR